MDQPQDVHTRMLHSPLKCIEHHQWTSGAHGYVQNAFAALHDKESDDDDDDVHTVITKMASLTTQSHLTATTPAEFNSRHTVTSPAHRDLCIIITTNITTL